MPWWMHVIGFLFGLACVVAGVVFRPFWHSEWGIPAFFLLCFVSTTIGLGYGGSGKPYSLPFGLACGCLLVFGLFVTMYTNSYIGVLTMLGLGYLGTKTAFFAKRTQQLKEKVREK